MRQKGFTILETLLAMTLFAIVISSSYGIFSMGMEIWRRTQGSATYEREALLALERMGTHIRSMVKMQDGDLLGEGKRSQLKIPSLFEEFDEEGVAHPFYGYVIYDWDRNARTLCVRHERAYSMQKADDKGCRPLVHQVKNVEFEYWLYKGIGESYSWYDRFDTSDDPPQAIKITLELDSKLQGEKTSVKREYIRTFLVPVGGKPMDPPEIPL